MGLNRFYSAVSLFIFVVTVVCMGFGAGIAGAGKTLPYGAPGVSWNSGKWDTIVKGHQTGYFVQHVVDNVQPFKVMSPVFAPKVAPHSYTLGISSLGYPAVNVQTVMSLLLLHGHNVNQGHPHKMVSGQDGWPLLVGLLEEDMGMLKGYFARHAKIDVAPGSYDEGRLDTAVTRLLHTWNGLKPETSGKNRRIVAQMDEWIDDGTGKVDWKAVEQAAGAKDVAMLQYRLDQAARRNPYGARYPILLLFGEDGPNVEPKSFDPHKEGASTYSSPEALTELIRGTRKRSPKPISLKLPVGWVKDLDDLFAHLKKKKALPDHIQLDGADTDISAGSLSILPGLDTHLPIMEATIVMDALLKKHRVRDDITVEATGGTVLPIDYVERLALGADGAFSARTWLGLMGGVNPTKGADHLKDMGIISGSNESVSWDTATTDRLSRGSIASDEWHLGLWRLLSEAGADPTAKPSFRTTHGLAAKGQGKHRLKMLNADGRWVSLDKVFTPAYVYSLLEEVMRRSDVERWVFGKTKAD